MIILGVGLTSRRPPGCRRFAAFVDYRDEIGPRFDVPVSAASLTVAAHSSSPASRVESSESRRRARRLLSLPRQRSRRQHDRGIAFAIHGGSIDWLAQCGHHQHESPSEGARGARAGCRCRPLRCWCHCCLPTGFRAARSRVEGLALCGQGSSAAAGGC